MANKIREAVLDASVLVQSVIEERYTDSVLQFLRDLKRAYAPSLILYEMGDVLAKSASGELMTPEDALRKYNLVKSTPILEIGEPEMEHAMKIAVGYTMTFYDASYVALAMETDTVLVTADRGLSRKAKGMVKALHAEEL